MSALGSQRIHELSLYVPEFGSPRADLVLEGGDVPAVGTIATLEVAGLSMLVTVLRSDLDAPDRPHVVVVGGAGWERPASPSSHQFDAGVRLSTVLADLAHASGETIEQPPDVVLGTYFAAPASNAGGPVLLRDVLSALSHAGYVAPWRVDPDGVTRFGQRAGVPVRTRATVLRRNAGVGMTTLGIDAPASFLPGNAFDGQAIRRLIVRETPGKLEADVYTATRSIVATIMRKVAECFPALFYAAPRTYVVAGVQGDKRLDLIPPPDAQYLPELNAVEQWSLAGALLTPAMGALVSVSFRDANPTRPVVLGWGLGAPTLTSIDATQITLGTGSPPAAARVGDTVDLGTITTSPAANGSPTQFIYTPPGGSAQPATAILHITAAKIATGSAKVAIQ